MRGARMDHDDEYQSRLEAEIRRLKAAGHPGDWGFFRWKRVVIRTSRITAGGILLFVSYLCVVAAGRDVGRPIASLSISDLGRILLFGFFGIIALRWGFECAFGSYDTNQGWREDLERQARANLSATDFSASQDDAVPPVFYGPIPTRDEVRQKVIRRGAIILFVVYLLAVIGYLLDPSK